MKHFLSIGFQEGPHFAVVVVFAAAATAGAFRPCFSLTNLENQEARKILNDDVNDEGSFFYYLKSPQLRI